MSAIEKRIEALALTLVTDMEACKYSVGKEAAAYLAIAAAEERGRRAGIEGLTDAKALLTEIRHELLREDGGHGSIAELPESLRRASTVARLSAAIRALDAALAPRDSAPATGNYPGCGDPAHDCRDGVCGARPEPRDSAPECGHLLSRDLGAEWRCGKPAGHEGPHSGTKP